MQVFDIQYFGNINYYSTLVKAENATICLNDAWYKMGFLNRCWILGANGKMELSIPVKGGRNQHSILKEVEIDYTQNWQKQHIRAIMTSYSKSPFYEYYFPRVAEMLNTNFQFLWELNLVILQQSCKWLKHPTPNILEHPLNFSLAQNSMKDFRKNYLPKNMSQFPTFKPYNQVFSNKFEFVPHLSILDLFFCEGPNAKQILVTV